MVLDASGNLPLVNFAGTSNRLLLADVNDNFVALPQGTAGQFLSSNGTWQTLPTVATPFSNTGLDIFIPNPSKFGIGKSNIQVTLDLLGDASFINIATIANKLQLKFFLLYPNPNNGSFTYVNVCNGEPTSTMLITNLEGKTVYRSSIFNNSPLDLNINHLKNGLYIVKVINKNSSDNFKLTINY